MTLSLTHWLTDWLSHWVTFTFAIKRAILETCYHWDIWSVRWGDMTRLRKTYQIQKSEFFFEILRIFQNSENFPKPEKFPKIWEFSKKLKIFPKSKNFPKIWKFSENLKIYQKSENFPKIWIFLKIWKFFWSVHSSCFLITLMKCLKGHKSLRSLFNVKIFEKISDFWKIFRFL